MLRSARGSYGSHSAGTAGPAKHRPRPSRICVATSSWDTSARGAIQEGIGLGQRHQQFLDVPLVRRELLQQRRKTARIRGRFATPVAETKPLLDVAIPDFL